MTFPFDDSIFDEGVDVDQVELIGGTHRRRLVVLLIDTSSSMAMRQADGTIPVEALNAQLASWLPKVRKEGQGNLRDGEFAAITFGDGGVRVVTDADDPRTPNLSASPETSAFVPAHRLQIGPFRAGGATPMVEAIELALDLVERRRIHLQNVENLQTGVPRVILFSDGAPTDSQGNFTDDWRRTAEHIRDLSARRRIQFFAFGVPGVDEQIMKAFATDRGFYRLGELDFKKLLDLILLATSSHDPYQALEEMGEELWESEP